MGDRHGGRFARRGHALNPPRPQVDAHHGVGFRWRATVFRCRGVVGRICPAQERSPRRRPPDTARRRKDLPTQEHAPRRRPPDTAHERKNLPHTRMPSSAKASRHGARAKGFAPRENALLSEGLLTRHEGEKICPAREGSPRRRSPDTAHERKDLPRGSSRSPHVPTNGGPPSADAPKEKHPFGGVAPTARGRCRVHSPKKIRLLHETQLFYGESHVGSR